VSSLESQPVIDEAGLALQCPNCGSKNFYNRFISMRGVKGIVSALVAIFLDIFPIYYKTVHRCKECDTEF
jgi:uncharacterized protein (DUF983 family)